MVFASLLLFGCLGGPEPQDTGPATGNGQPATGNGTPATGNGQPDTGSGTPDAASIATYTAAVAAGIPLVCTAVVNQETTKFWIKGENMVISSTGGERPFSAIMKNNDLYMELSAEDKASYAEMNLTCDWWLMKGEEGNETGTQGTGPGTSFDTTSYQGPNIKWSCVLGTFGDEKFATPGNACTGEDLMNAMQAQYQQ